MERKWWTLVLVSIATFMLLLDITVVNVALPDIQRELNASLSEPAVGGRRLLADARRLPADAGSLGDRLGRRRSSRSAFGIFTLASFLCGIADDPTLLNLARGLQGIGGAGDVRDLAGADRPGVPRQGPGDRVRRSGGRRSAAPSRSGRWSAG